MAFGARVTAMASAGNLALLRELGAETALDYRTAELAALGQSFDGVLDTFGALSVWQARALLRPGGGSVPLNFGLREIVAALWPCSRRRVKIHVNADRAEDLEALLRLWAEGRHKRGAVVLCMGG